MPALFQNFGRNKDNVRAEQYVDMKNAIDRQVYANAGFVDEWDRLNRTGSVGARTPAEKKAIDVALNKKNNGIKELESLWSQMNVKYPKAERDARDAQEDAQNIERKLYGDLRHKFPDYDFTQNQTKTLVDAKVVLAAAETKLATEVAKGKLARSTEPLQQDVDSKKAGVAAIISKESLLNKDGDAKQYSDAKIKLDALSAGLAGTSAPSSGSGWGLLSGTAPSVPLAYATSVPSVLGAAVPFSPTDSFIQVPAAVVAADVDSISVRLRRSTTAGYTDNFYPENIEFFNKSGVSERKVDKFGALEGSLFDVESVVGKAAPVVPPISGPPSVVLTPVVPGSTPISPTTTGVISKIEAFINMCIEPLTPASSSVESITYKCSELRKVCDAKYAEAIDPTNIKKYVEDDSSGSKINEDAVKERFIEHYTNISEIIEKIETFGGILRNIKGKYDAAITAVPSITEDQKLVICKRMLTLLYMIMYYIEYAIPNELEKMTIYNTRINPITAPIFGSNGRGVVTAMLGAVIRNVQKSELYETNAYNVKNIGDKLTEVYNSGHNASSSLFELSMINLDIPPYDLMKAVKDTNCTATDRERFNKPNMCVYVSVSIGNLIANANNMDHLNNQLEWLIIDGKFYINHASFQTGTPTTTFTGGRKTRSRAAARRARRTHAQRRL